MGGQDGHVEVAVIRALARSTRRDDVMPVRYRSPVRVEVPPS
jgi:hypothetical protein